MHVEVDRPVDLSPAAVPQWQIRFHVSQQNVPDMSRGMNPREEDWEDNGQDLDAEHRFDAKLRLEFGMKLPIYQD